LVTSKIFIFFCESLSSRAYEKVGGKKSIFTARRNNVPVIAIVKKKYRFRQNHADWGINSKWRGFAGALNA